ncbi:protoporphyrinogen oxidase [Dactylosporangium roseum]|uniref:Coproporphyrinogen III oxidase n=1 Tax=Dactylosporangium roseum TaxID=47989 RepID=A0ABY5Z8H6_9ACTN|nr:protoporphyrinogen oxidase [Dactylosporangium roseum]UWZ38364.1 protoporphyrinogen oxidase [Dactylosporangium roseum]
MTKRVVVVGGGIAGLAAAHRLAGAGVDVVVVEQGERPGGKLRTGSLAGGPVERGAESFLVADPAGGASAALRLADAVGLAGAVVHPTAARAAVSLDGGLRDLPSGTLMGIPLRGEEGVPDVPSAAPLLPPGGDVTVGELVRPRRGDAVVDHYVEPLLGGVYAGRADALSLRMALPALAAAAERSHTLTEALQAAVAARSGTPGGPVFGTIEGGMSRLVEAVAATLPDVRLGLPVRALRRHGAGWRLTVGSNRDASTLDADGVVLAVPAAPAARLLSTVDGIAGVPLDYASVALVALALPATKLPDLSGFLVPATEGHAVKAVTFFDRKWAHLRRPGVTVLRASVGRHGDEEVLRRTDANLVELVRHELAVLLGIDALPDHVDSGVYRWGGALPQYRPHHRERVEDLRAALRTHPAIVVAGAAYDGVGIPACVKSGWAAAGSVLEGLGE